MWPYRGATPGAAAANTVRVIVPPPAIITLDEAKAHLRVDASDDDALIAGMTMGATAALDGPTGWLGRALGVQQLEVSIPHPRGNWIELPFPPIISIDAVTYDDSSGAEQTVSPATYALRRGGIRLLSGSWPAAEDGIRVRYTAGYQSSDSPPVAAVPANALAAIKIMLSGMYSFREDILAGRYTPIPDVNSVKNLVGPLRIWAV